MGLEATVGGSEEVMGGQIVRLQRKCAMRQRKPIRGRHREDSWVLEGVLGTRQDLGVQTQMRWAGTCEFRSKRSASEGIEGIRQAWSQPCAQNHLGGLRGTICVAFEFDYAGVQQIY